MRGTVTDETVETAATVDGRKPAAAGADELIGKTIDRYVVVAKLGEGGMGVVYAAHDPALDRRVALKVLPPLDESSRIHLEARLRREAQALARLDHENVVAVYDVGVAERSVFVAMQLVEGTTLDEHLAETRLEPRRVLELFAAAGRGLAAAHAGGIVHRDFKPSNVFVDRRGGVFVGDFGLARAGEDPPERISGESSLLDEQMTRQGAVMGTPLYMAPEQHRGDAVTAATDQFAFCVSVWEALFGAHPFRDGAWSRTRVLAAMDADRVREPPRTRGVPARAVRALRRGLRRDPQARWPSMSALIAELTPRSRAPWLWSGLTLGGIAGGLVVASMLGQPAAGDPCQAAASRLDEVWNATVRRRVLDAFAATGVPDATVTAERVVAALDERGRAWATGRIETCRATRVRGEQSAELLDLRMQCLELRLGEMGALVSVLVEPDAAVVARADDGLRALTHLDACADASALRGQPPPPSDPAQRAVVEQLDAAVSQVRIERIFGERHTLLADIDPLVALARETGWSPLIARALYESGSARVALDHLDDAVTILREAATEAIRARDDRLAAEALIDVASALEGGGHARDALQVIADAELLAARVERDPRLAAHVLGTRSRVLSALSRYQEAEEALTQAIAILAPLPDQSLYAEQLGNLGILQIERGDLERATESLQRALAITAQVPGEHPSVLALRLDLAGAHLRAGRAALAQPELEAVLAIQQRIGDPAAVTTIHELGNAAYVLGHLDEAARRYREELAIAPDSLEARYQLAAVLHDQGHDDEALAMHHEVLAARIATFGEQHAAVADSLDALGRVHGDREEPALAQPFFERALATRTTVFGADHPTTVGTLAALARVLEGQDACDLAVKHGRQVLAVTTDDRDRVQALVAIAPCLLRHHPREAKQPLEQLIPLLEAAGAAEMVTWARGALAEVEALPR